jgi:ketosteroid isomerase-like protein
VRDLPNAERALAPVTVDAEIVQASYDAWNLRDGERLVELAHPEVEITPLLMGLTSPGPWRGHDGVRRLVAEASRGWSRFDLRCDKVSVFGPRAVTQVHVEVAARGGGPTVTGDIAHVLDFEDGLVRRWSAYRDHDEAVAAAQA